MLELEGLSQSVAAARQAAAAAPLRSRPSSRAPSPLPGLGAARTPTLRASPRAAAGDPTAQNVALEQAAADVQVRS